MPYAGVKEPHGSSVRDPQIAQVALQSVGPSANSVQNLGLVCLEGVGRVTVHARHLVEKSFLFQGGQKI